MQQSKEKNVRFNHAFRAIKNVTQLLLKEKDCTKLLQGICANLIKGPGYYDAASIAILDEKGNLLGASEAGLDGIFLKTIQQLEKGKVLDCVRLAMRQPEIVYTETPYPDCVDCPLSEKYKSEGSMCIRMNHDGKVYGLLVVFISKEFMADEEEHGLLRGVAGDIALALHNLELGKERDLARQALLESEKSLRSIIKNSLTGISIVRLKDNQFLFRNPEDLRITECSYTKCDPSCVACVHPDDADMVKKLNKSLFSREIKHFEAYFRIFPGNDRNKSKSRMRWIYCRANSIKYQGEEAILFNTMDITRIKETEYLLMIQDKMASLGRVAAGIAHEIRNPLSGMNIYLNAMEKIWPKKNGSQKIEEMFAKMHSASAKIESVIKRVMDFSMPSEPKLVLMDINKPLEDATALITVTLRKKGIVLEKHLSKTLPLCLIDACLVEEVILNLLNNAAEAVQNMEGERKIGLQTAEEKNHVIVKVFDSGMGISPKLREKIFDPFYTTKHSTGIGLTLSHRIIKDHNGALNVSKSKWGGAEFIIKVPIANGGVGL